MDFTAWDAAVVLMKAASYAATLCASGQLLFLCYCRDLLEASLQASLRKAIPWLSFAAVAASLLKIILLAGSMSGEWSGMFDRSFNGMILAAGEARATGARIIGLALMSASVVTALRSKRALGAQAVIGALIAATSFAWTGHVHAQLPQIAPTVVLCIHLMCAAFWLGALPPLLQLTSGRNPAAAAECATRFSRWAVSVVAMLMLAGACLLFALLEQTSDLWSTDYGRLVLVKLFLVGLLLSAAAANKLRLTPRLLRSDGRALLQLRRSIQAEMLLAALILVVTAAFTTLTGPPR